ncbi:hypothetical protein USDA257_p01540 (plasmid) [Sinorhizobium fredii USDA 257]|uniref:Uncharacterized protein n=1 Tax=Sinorhizobium fredii (strain USDA 257) TaxID=1185652 RepID=I3XG65_SINF2|nr:hypothetical protein USDA257_p01540 [Sinorhizobium fredii USDA 257]
MTDPLRWRESNHDSIAPSRPYRQLHAPFENGCRGAEITEATPPKPDL